MDRKKGLMAGIAVGAVAVLVASTLAQCALRSAVEQGDEGGKTQAVQSDVKDAGLSELYGMDWRSDDGKWKSYVMDGVMIEFGEGGDAIVYYEVEESESDDSAVRATLATSKEQGGKKAESQLSAAKSASGMRLSCDVLTHEYAASTGKASIELVGASDELEKLLEKAEGDIAAAISSWASTRSPYAAKATWGKEAWIDYARETKATTFTLGDASETIVSVVVDVSGKLEVS